MVYMRFVVIIIIYRVGGTITDCSWDKKLWESSLLDVESETVRLL